MLRKKLLNAAYLARISISSSLSSGSNKFNSSTKLYYSFPNQFHFVPAAAADAPAAALPPATFAAAAPRMALTIWAVPGSRPLRLLISASLSPAPTAPGAKPAPVIWLMMPPMIACTAIFRPLPSSFMLWARRNASSPKTAASSCCSSIFFLSKSLPSSLRAFSVSRLSAEISCVGFSLMSMVPSAMTTSIVRSASGSAFYSRSCSSSCLRRLSSNASDISSRALMASFS